MVRVRLVTLPTAVHERSVAHDTPNRKPLLAPAGIGVGRIVHRLPFQRSASVRPAPAPFVV